MILTCMCVFRFFLHCGSPAAAIMCASVMFALAMLRAAANLHNQLVTYVLRLPMAFFDTTPVGRLLNRFSKDVDALDNTLPFILRGWITTLLQVLLFFFLHFFSGG